MAVQNYISGDSAVKIAASVESAVAAGRAAAGAVLPPVRTLASSLTVSPATVASAYRLLQERGIAVSDGRRGTRIRHASPVAPAATLTLPDDMRNLAAGNPDPDLLPDLAAAIRRAPFAPKLYGDELNDPHLLAMARRQFAADRVPAENVAVVSGALDGIERVLREHLRAGDRVAVEDPCFTGILDLLNALSLVAVPVAVDDEGPIANELQKTIRTIQAFIVTPRAQNPAGAAISAARAKRLRAVLAGRPELLVVEHDHAGPVAGAPYVTLADAARASWAVVRSVSKSLGPDLRVALLAGDARTIARVEGRQTLGIRWVSHVLQTVVAALWSDRNVQKRLARAERMYAARRALLIDELASRGIEAHGVSGLNVWIPVAEESTAVQALFQRRWAVTAGERYRLRTPPAIRVTISTLTREEAIAFADDLASILRPTQRRAVV
ncbi:MAG: GntR family transcriptional regulator [Acidobacteria bacterium]|nr:GntR family transcriptional regulator [Acidobacteriota bacterium]